MDGGGTVFIFGLRRSVEERVPEAELGDDRRQLDDGKRQGIHAEGRDLEHPREEHRANEEHPDRRETGSEVPACGTQASLCKR